MRIVGAAVLAAAAVTAAGARTTTEIEIAPGPTVMSEAEKAIVADPSKGAEHGVILSEETDRNDNWGAMARIAYRMRAKILSPEGRGLADVVIPVERGQSDLKTWWGRTIFPDGRVQEFPQDDLKAQSVAKWSSGEIKELRGALSGVVPGCVIEYGYVITVQHVPSSTRVFLQKSWPVRSFRYRWMPSREDSASFILSRAEKLPVTTQKNIESVLVTAHDLEPVPEEPYMPPLDEVRASATFYYATHETAQDYWDERAKRFDEAIKAFLDKSEAKTLIKSLNLPADASLKDKLEAAYAWLGTNLKNTTLRSAEEAEARVDNKNKKDTYDARTVLTAGEATPLQLALLYAGLARALGADANVVFGVDRTDRFWNKSLKSMAQFSYTLVAVRAPGASDDKPVVVAPGSGLPYGVLPWKATSAAALMCTAKGAVTLMIPAAAPVINRVDTQVALSFSEDNETMLVKWDRSAAGSAAADRRRWLRGLNARERKEKLDYLCGASGTIEVTGAKLPSLDEATGPFRIACELEESNTSIGDGAASYLLPWTGPWWPSTPELTEHARVHPVVFDYPTAEIVGVDVTAPHGFKPKEAPAQVKLESPYGRYVLVVAATATGYRVDRLFALTAASALTNEYDGLRKFLDDVLKADQTRLAFERVRDSK